MSGEFFITNHKSKPSYPQSFSILFYVFILSQNTQIKRKNRFLLVLQQFGVIPFEIRTLKKHHTEQRRTRRFYITVIVRHRGTVGAWRNRGYLRVLLMFFLLHYKAQWFARFLKTFITKVISNTYTTPLSLFVPSAPP